VSFAHLVYSSSWLKVHYPAAFTAGLLNSQPMGFWSPQSLVADARRHGVRVRRPHVNRSEVGASLEGVRSDPVLLLGLASVRGVGEATAERIVAGRPWNGSEDLVRRAGVTQAQLETLAAAGALDPVGEEVPGSVTSLRRRLLWGAGAAAQGTPDRLPGVVVGAEAPPLPEPSLYDSVADDLWALGLAPERTAMHLARERLEAMGVMTAVALESSSFADGDRAVVAGVVTHRQHPETARGAVFLNLEDETGHVNVVFSRGAWARWKHVARHTPVLLIRGRVRKGQGAVSFDAERVEALVVGTAVPASRDFR
jgi:error-prone DNA polymerase